MQQKQSKMGVMPIPSLLLTMTIPMMLSLLVQGYGGRTADDRL